MSGRCPGRQNFYRTCSCKIIGLKTAGRDGAGPVARAWSATEAAELQAENNVAAENLKSMEERIKVLEKIITDRETDLRDKFRDLEEGPEP